MQIPYFIQKRSLIVLYAEGVQLENFRLRIFQEQITLAFGKEEGSLQCSFTPGALQDSWTVDFQPTGSDRFESYQIEDDGTLMMQDGQVNASLCSLLHKTFDAAYIRLAVVYVQDKGHQKVVIFIASPTILPRIPGTFLDRNGDRRILHYKQPDVHVKEQTSNIYVKETRADHHVGAHIKGLHQGARLSGFFPLPGNSLSRRRFSQLQLFNFDIGNKDVQCNILDEFVPICLIDAELNSQEISQLLDIILRQRNLFDHHTVFLECSVLKPFPCSQASTVITTLPDTECIVHCQIDKGQKLSVLQPRFERGKVSKCFSNTLQLSVYQHTNILLFLPGQIETYDVFDSAPCGRVLAVWHKGQNGLNSRTAKTSSAAVKTMPFKTVPTTNSHGTEQTNDNPANVDDNKQSPVRSIPSSSDHNKETCSPLPTDLDATGSTSQVSVESLHYAEEYLSPPRPSLASDKRSWAGTVLPSTNEINCASQE